MTDAELVEAAAKRIDPIAFDQALRGFLQWEKRREVAREKARAVLAVARPAHFEECARKLEDEASACVRDIVSGDDVGASLAHSRAGALLTAAADIRAAAKA